MGTYNLRERSYLLGSALPCHSCFLCCDRFLSSSDFLCSLCGSTSNFLWLDCLYLGSGEGFGFGSTNGYSGHRFFRGRFGSRGLRLGNYSLCSNGFLGNGTCVLNCETWSSVDKVKVRATYFFGGFTARLWGELDLARGAWCIVCELKKFWGVGPNGPLGRRKMPFSLPEVIARLSWLAVDGFRSMWYLFSTNCRGYIKQNCQSKRQGVPFWSSDEKRQFVHLQDGRQYTPSTGDG